MLKEKIEYVSEWKGGLWETPSGRRILDFGERLGKRCHGDKSWFQRMESHEEGGKALGEWQLFGADQGGEGGQKHSTCGS